MRRIVSDPPGSLASLTLGWLVVALLVGGCSTAGGHLVQAGLAPLGFASKTAVDHDSRWRLPASSAVTVVSASPTPISGWVAASVGGLQSQFPVVQAASQAGADTGWTLYVRWPDQASRAQPSRAGPIAGIPERFWQFLSHTPSARIGVVCVDNVSRAVVHHGELRVHASWWRANTDQASLVREAFARYARVLASG